MAVEYNRQCRRDFILNYITSFNGYGLVDRALEIACELARPFARKLGFAVGIRERA